MTKNKGDGNINIYIEVHDIRRDVKEDLKILKHTLLET